MIQPKQLKPVILEGIFVLLLAIAIGHAGPYGTYEKFDLSLRLAFWILVLLLPWGLYKALNFTARQFISENVSATLLNVFLIPLFALLGSALITLINIKVGIIDEQSFFNEWSRSIFVWLVFAFGLVMPMTLIVSALAREERKSGVVSMMEFFHYKLPDSLKGGELLALKSEDHYLRVITNRGSALILMKFEDALAALNGYPGVQTHRSWWVASRQLDGLEQLKPSTTSITLADLTEVPVSRRRRKLVNEHIAQIALNRRK